MWVERKRTWIETVLLGGAALPHIWTRTLAVTALSVLVTLVYQSFPHLAAITAARPFSLTAVPFTLVGLPLGIFLGFRNNTAYDRFWEGRKLWGSLVNTSRSLARQWLTLLEPAGAERGVATDAKTLRAFEVECVRHVIAYGHALRHHLRDASVKDKLATIIPLADAERYAASHNPPIALLLGLGERLVEARRRGWIHPFHVPLIEASLVSLTDIQGGCERIKATPIPFSYTVLMHRIVAGYCCFLPFGLMDSLAWATPFVVLTVSYCLFGLDAIGEELEQPFGFDTNDLPLEAITQTIDRDLRMALAEPLPAPSAPRQGVLR